MNIRAIKKTSLLLTVVLALFAAAVKWVPLPEEKLDPPQAYRFYDRGGHLLNMIISRDGYFRMHVNAEDISPLFIRTLLLYEDKNFYHHYGVDPLAVLRALKQNLTSSRVVSGGSTLTMQLSRMLQRRDRTYWAKLVEMFRAVQLEARFSKREILAHYLAIAPYGGNIEGIEAAAYFYFGKSARHLSVAEVALLVAIPQSPNSYRPDLHPKRARKQRDRILQLMLANRLITQGQYERALVVPVKVQRKPVKTHLAHAAWRHRAKHPRDYIVKTTIDENMQLRAEQLLRTYIDRIRKHNITNGAIVIIDNKTREVRALVGSSDFFSKSRLGANDGSFTPRSPGSTLKPFIYGLALQEGIISHKTKLYDVPMTFHGYSPINFSHSYRGLVSVQRALADSLNVVAVELTRKVGVQKLQKLLKDGGISTIKTDERYYGLPLVLGGVEVRLIELTNLYSSLANQGVYKPYALFPRQSSNPAVDSTGKRLLSKEASWLVTQILTDVERPDFPASWKYSKHRPTIAWKTGTSYGQRDAWSVGYTPEFTIGVWLGNFDSSPSRGLVGGHAAGPLLFDVFQAVSTNPNSSWFRKPAHIKTRHVCSVSGKRATRFCKHTTREFYIDSPQFHAHDENCQIHQPIYAKLKLKLKQTPHKQQQVFEIWPPKVARFLHRHGIPVQNVPAYEKDNMAGEKYYRPEIVSPSKHAIYYQRFDRLKPEEHGIRLSVAVTNRIKKVYWYLDNQLIASGEPYQDYIINPKPGNYKLTVVDDTGGTSSVRLRVVEYRERGKTPRPQTGHRVVKITP